MNRSLSGSEATLPHELLGTAPDLNTSKAPGESREPVQRLDGHTCRQRRSLWPGRRAKVAEAAAGAARM
jgi:hypothetical protein